MYYDLVAKLIINPISRRVVNFIYNLLSTKFLERFHYEFSKLFTGREFSEISATWNVNFLGKRIVVPIRRESAWLDWDTAISIIGHDTDIKTSYARLLSSNARPDIFLDIGANYGTHSLLIGCQGISVVAFEPNWTCIEYGKRLHAANALSIRWEHVALGATPGMATLSYRERETWSGSLVVAPPLAESDLKHEDVEVAPLDNYTVEFLGKKVLMKVDIEGHEGDMFVGASKFLDLVRPFIIFECNSDRKRVYDILKKNNYYIGHLPWSPDVFRRYDQATFSSERKVNFLAIPHQLVI